MKASYFEACTISSPQGREMIISHLRDLIEMIFDEDQLYFQHQLDVEFYMRASYFEFTHPQQRECWRNIQTSLGLYSSTWSVQTYILCCYIIHKYYHESCSEKTSESPTALHEARTLFFDLFKQIYLNETQRETHGYPLHVLMYFCLYMSYQHYYSTSYVESSLWNLYIDGLFYYLNSNDTELDELISIYKKYLDDARKDKHISHMYDDLHTELRFYYRTCISNTADDRSLPILDSNQSDYYSILESVI